MLPLRRRGGFNIRPWSRQMPRDIAASRRGEQCSPEGFHAAAHCHGRTMFAPTHGDGRCLLGNRRGAVHMLPQNCTPPPIATGEQCSPLRPTYGCVQGPPSANAPAITRTLRADSISAPTHGDGCRLYRKNNRPSPSASTVRVSPAAWAPAMISFAIIVSTWDWMYRFSGRAP